MRPVRILLALLLAGIASAADVGVTSIISPTGTLDSGTTVTPQCSVYNFGSAFESYWVRLQISSTVTDSVPVTNHAAGTALLVTFPAWTAKPRGVLSVKCSTRLATDTWPANDARTTSVNVAVHDIGVAAIVKPWPRPLPGPNPVGAQLRNYGTAREAATVTFMISGGYVSTVSLGSGLPVGADTTIQFPPWTAVPGAYTARCSTYLSTDSIPANDTLGRVVTVIAADTWCQLADVPLGLSGKKVKDGGSLAWQLENDTDRVYLFKGNNTTEFYCYNYATNIWATKESIPPVGRSGRRKRVKKGACLTTVEGKVYGAKGNNSLEFWRFTPGGTGSWTQLADVPSGTRTVREGAGLAGLTLGDTDYVYMLKGSKTQEFYRYNVQSNAWQTMASAPLGASGKTWKNGSCITYDSSHNVIFALKNTVNEFFKYWVDSNAWVQRTTLPLAGSSGKKKKVGAGAGIAYCPGSGVSLPAGVYTLKGNNTTEFWLGQDSTGTWTQLTDVPMPDGKRVKGGGAICCGSHVTDDPLFVTIGNNTDGFVSYPPRVTNPFDCLGGNTALAAASPSRVIRLAVAPNPLTVESRVACIVPRAGYYRLQLYDVTGQLVTTVAEGYAAAGNYALTLDALRIARGIYVLKLDAPGLSAVQKVIVE